MKKLFAIGLLVFGIVGPASWAGNSTDQKIHQDVKQLKKDYQRKVEKDLKALGTRIRHLKNKVVKTGGQAKTGVDKEIRDLEVQKSETDHKFAELKKSTGDAWKDLRRGVDDALADLKKAVDDAAERLKSK